MSASPGLSVLQHALGVDAHGRGRQYRSHFVAGGGHDDYATCLALVELGLMTRRAGTALTGGDDLFQVTPAGRAWMAKHSPPPPKLSPGARRYRDYLDEESSLSFGDWLKRRPRPAPMPHGEHLLYLTDEDLPF